MGEIELSAAMRAKVLAMKSALEEVEVSAPKLAEFFDVPVHAVQNVIRRVGIEPVAMKGRTRLYSTGKIRAIGEELNRLRPSHMAAVRDSYQKRFEAAAAKYRSEWERAAPSGSLYKLDAHLSAMELKQEELKQQVAASQLVLNRAYEACVEVFLRAIQLRNMRAVGDVLGLDLYPVLAKLPVVGDLPAFSHDQEGGDDD